MYPNCLFICIYSLLGGTINENREYDFYSNICWQRINSRFNRKKMLFIYILLQLKCIAKWVELPNFPQLMALNSLALSWVSKIMSSLQRHHISFMLFQFFFFPLLSKVGDFSAFCPHKIHSSLRSKFPISFVAESLLTVPKQKGYYA